jgi:RHS repeat-associated protein
LGYFPYGYLGGVCSNYTPTMNPGFATYHNDCSSGLEYAMNRYYDPARGRFTTVDQGEGDLANPLSFNRYSYASNDPVNRYDPDGATSVCAGDLVGSGGINPASNPCAIGYQVVFFAPLITLREWDDVHPRSPVVSKPPSRTCTLEVESNPLNSYGRRGPDLHGALDFTWTVGTSNVLYVAEGYPNSHNQLVAEVALGIGPVGNTPGGGSNDGSITGPQVCGALDILETAAFQINSANITYNNWGPNSNSVLRYMLQSLNSLLGSSWYSIPWTLVGYNTLLPGLEGPRGPRPPGLGPRRPPRH